MATLVLPKREFGEVIRAVRDELGITPVTQLPSPTFVNQLGEVDLGDYHRGIPRRGYLARRCPATIAEFNASDAKHLEMLYRELSRIYHSYIPDEFLDAKQKYDEERDEKRDEEQGSASTSVTVTH